MILAGETATAHLVWDTTGSLGARDMWIGIDHLTMEEYLYADTWANVMVYLKLYRPYLPLVFKDS